MDFKLRPWTLNDVDNLVKYANNWNVAKYLTDAFPHPYNVEDGKIFLEKIFKNDPVNVFAIEIDGQAVGSIGIHPQKDVHRKSAELGYWLAEPFWGKGIMTRAIKEMIEVAFQTYDINRIFAKPFGINEGSKRVLEKAGFKLEATLEKAIFKNGEYLDELIYAFIKI